MTSTFKSQSHNDWTALYRYTIDFPKTVLGRNIIFHSKWLYCIFLSGTGVWGNVSEQLIPPGFADNRDTNYRFLRLAVHLKITSTQPMETNKENQTPPESPQQTLRYPGSSQWPQQGSLLNISGQLTNLGRWHTPIEIFLCSIVLTEFPHIHTSQKVNSWRHEGRPENSFYRERAI